MLIREPFLHAALDLRVALRFRFLFRAAAEEEQRKHRQA